MSTLNQAHSNGSLPSLIGSFAGGTWDWEYLGFASPEVSAYFMVQVFTVMCQ